MYYTIGQRKGLNLGGNQDRIYVVGKDLNKNILYIAHGDENKYLVSTSAIIEQVNWIGDIKPKKCCAKFRYQGIKSVTPGQACVFYLGEECLGGGIIKEVQKNHEKLWYL